MAEVMIVCVSDDLPQAEGLAEMFELGGFEVRDNVFDDFALARAAAGVLVVTPAALACERFCHAAERVMDMRKAVLACLAPAQHWFDAPAVELYGWYGIATDPALGPLYHAVDKLRRDKLRARIVGPVVQPELLQAQA